MREQLVFEAFLRYYDLISHTEALTDLKQRKLRKSIGLSKQKVIFYLSYIKSSEMFGPEDKLGCKQFVSMFVTDKIY